MRDDIDIVDTLRRNSLYIPTSRINSFGMAQMGFELTSFGLIAADEIERLRRGGCARDQRTTQFCAEAVALQELNEGLRWSIRNAERDLTEMREERDAVRRKFCEMCASVGGVYRRVGRENVECRTAEEIAEICGWDCYEVKP